uniref:Putative ovule protein n=1 Tax=Solanum chacoense TaxID=4108 RepID=A0A0V0GVP0_SOLCH
MLMKEKDLIEKGKGVGVGCRGEDSAKRPRTLFSRDGSTLRINSQPFFTVLVIGELTRHIQEEAP